MLAETTADSAFTACFTQPEPDGRVALWSGTGLDDPARKLICWTATAASAEALAVHLCQAGRLSGQHALSGWHARDVVAAYGVSPAEAGAFLDTISDALVEAQTRAGWELIGQLSAQLPDARTAAQKAAWWLARQQAEEAAERALARW